MYRPHRATVLVLALLWIAFGPAVATTKIEHHHTRTVPVAPPLYWTFKEPSRALVVLP